jgi:hypothetical protein
MSDPITWKPPGSGRFRFVHELPERVTDTDIENRSLKLKTDCSVAMDKIDRALESRGRHTRLELRSDQDYANAVVGLPIEIRNCGRILGVR